MLAVASAAIGQTWAEVGDAGDLPGTAQVITPPGRNQSLTRITGTNGPDDVDMYQFYVRKRFRSNFSASTVDGTTWDTQLWLFNRDGGGVSFNDNHVGGTTLQSTITGALLPTRGLYYLAVSRSNRDAVNAVNALIWANAPFRAERAPDGPGAGDPTPAAWTGSTAAGGAYTINLTGALYVPAPAAALGLGGLMALRRRRPATA